MQLAVTSCLVPVSALVVLLTTRSFGRLIGLSAAAGCGMSMAYFVMPPVFSFAIRNPFDVGALVLYGMASLVVIQTAPRRRDRSNPGPGSAATGANMGQIIEEALMRSERHDVEVSVDPRMMLPCAPHKALALVGVILDSAFSETEPIRISAYGGQASGGERVWLTVQHTFWPPEPKAAGIAEEISTPLQTPGAEGCSVTWFDNGYERVYQISFPA